ncbi:hypothetical protein K6U06_05810 [Acidiferrimicrobium sp. IK]|uniref:hypothetical protein n=1 Tax=Acidiferrimicrobium sp. IK TaxID=2871700 RepID=UPI0021CB22D8|nr:hypothetical protein [Acidiferrimicrobium sp. IK]MCU4183868.1 hypothetical protein [Acidiferrimicrobium sp. IK]
MTKPRWSRTEAAEHRAKLVADAQDVLAAEVNALCRGEDPYVASWASQGEDVAREIAATQRRVREATTAILAVSPAAHDTDGLVPGVEAAVEARRQARHAVEEEPAVSAAAVGLGVA